NPESVFLGLRQSRGRISVRNLFAVRKCRCDFDLEISADVSATGGCTLDRASFYARDRRVLPCARSRFFTLVIDPCRASRLLKRLDHLLGGERLVWCSRCVHLVAVGMVGSGTRSGFATNKMAIPLAGGVCLSPRYGRISLHGFDAAASGCVVIDQVTRPNAAGFLDSAAAGWRSARFWPFCTGVAGAS